MGLNLNGKIIENRRSKIKYKSNSVHNEEKMKKKSEICLKTVFELKNYSTMFQQKNNYEGNKWTLPGIINRCQTKRKHCSQRFEEKPLKIQES